MREIRIILLSLVITLMFPLWGQGLPNGLESYLDRPDILKIKPLAQKELEPIWERLKPVLPDTLAMLLESYPDREIYFLARDGELLFDYARVALKKRPEDLKRIHLLNISRANMNDPHILDYLAQEGISNKTLTSEKKVLFVDTGFSGTISTKLESLFPVKHKEKLQTHLLLSETSKYPSAKVFLNGLSNFANFLTPEELHGKIIALEHLPHYTERSDRFILIDGKWHPTSTKGGAPDGAVLYQQDLASFANDSKSQGRLSEQRKIWQTIRELNAKGEQKKLLAYFKNLRKSHQNDQAIEAIIADFLDISNDTTLAKQLDIKPVASSEAERVVQIKKSFPEIKSLIENPEVTLPELIKKGNFKEVSKGVELGIFNPNFRQVLLKELEKSKPNEKSMAFVLDLIELSHRDTLEEIPKAIFSKPAFIKTPGASLALTRFIHLAEEDAQDELLIHLVGKPHFTELTDAPKILQLLIERADDEGLSLINDLFNQSPHLNERRFAHLKGALSIEDAALRKAYFEKREAKPTAKTPEIEIKETKTSKKISFPDLSTDKKRLAYLISIKERIPGIFSQAAKYDIDLMNLLEDQDKLQKLLLENPEYRKTFEEEHQGWLTINITPKSEQVVKTVRISPESIEAWKSSLRETLQKTDSLQSAIKIESEYLKGRTAQGLETGLIISLPPEKRKEIFSKTGEERVKLLEQSLPANIGNDFKAENYGLPQSPKKEDVLLLLKKIRESETNLQRLVELHLVLQDNSGKIIKNGNSRIESLTGNELEYFTDLDAIKPKLQHIPHALNKEMASIVQKHVKGYAAQVESIEEKAGKAIRLNEAPPATGIFRGCAGGDCSSSLSFPYPNAPNERVFYVYDEHNELKGYVTGSLVEADKKKGFRIITIAGPRISSADTELIFEGLYQSRSNLNADMILLPTEEKIGALINYVPIRETYNKFISDHTPVNIQFIDQKSRTKIETFPSQNNQAFEYDKMTSNLQGVIYKRDQELPLVIDVTRTPDKTATVTPQRLKAEAYALVLDLLGSERDAQIQRILSAVDVSLRDQVLLMQLINNDKRLTVTGYQKKIMETFNLSEDQFFMKVSSFKEGLLNAPNFSKLKDLRYIDVYIYALITDPTQIETIVDPVILKNIIERGNETLNALLSKNIFKFPLSPLAEETLESFIKSSSDVTLINWLFDNFKFDDPKNIDQLLKALYAKKSPAIDEAIHKFVLWKPYAVPFTKERLNKFIAEGDTLSLSNIFRFAVRGDHAFEYKDEVLKMIRLKNPDYNKIIITDFFKQRHQKDVEPLLIEIINNAKIDELPFIAQQTFTLERNHNQGMVNALKAIVERADNTTGEILRNSVFSYEKSMYSGMPDHLILREALDIDDLTKRKNFLDKKIVTEAVAKVIDYKEISTDLKPNDKIKTKKGKVLTILSFIDEGKRGKVYKTHDKQGNHYALKVAIDNTPETLESINKESQKASLYKKYEIPHATIIEAQPTYVVKEWIEGVRADQWVRSWEQEGTSKSAIELTDLKKLIAKSAKSGVYIGDLNPKNMIWDGKRWIVVDSGGISEGLSKEESLANYLEKIPRRWSKDENGKKCPILFKALLKGITP